MDLKVLKWHILRGSWTRRLLLKAFMFASAMALVPLIQIVQNVTMEPLALSFGDCPLNIMLNPISAFAAPLFGSAMLNPCRGSDNVTIDVLKELMEKGLLDNGAKALCVGEGSPFAVSALRELGFSDASGVDMHPFFSLMRKQFVHELDFKDSYFDFVFARALDRVTVPALVVSEIERVLRPGGIGAVLVDSGSFYLGGLVRSAIPVSSFLRNSNVVDVRRINTFTLVIFKKDFDAIAPFEHYRLPDNCPSVNRNRPFIEYLEPLANGSSGQSVTELSYLPKFMNVSSKNRFVYVNIGAGDMLSSSVEKMFKPFYPLKPQALNVYFVHHDTTVLTSHVKEPGVTFVYHPGLAGDVPSTSSHSEEDLSSVPDDEGFDFIRWFKEAREEEDLVVLMMNAGVAELKILFELFESGAICHVDELFIRCSDSVDCKGSTCEDCTSLFRSLRNSGVFVHWW